MKQYVVPAFVIFSLMSQVQGAQGPDTSTLRVIQYVDISGKAKLVMLNGGHQQGVVDGAIMKSYRHTATIKDQTAKPIWVETGSLKALEVHDTFTIAKITKDGSQLSGAFFPKFSSVMAGDTVVENRVKIAKNLVVTPDLVITYGELFEDPGAYPNTFELSFEGKKKLEAVAKRFADLKVSLLMIEGYTDVNGGSKENQIESQQRAMTIRQYLIDEFEFDESRLAAIGMGEIEPLGLKMRPGYRDANRRIVFRVKASEDI